jgi:predicted metal-dependent hydrolase
MQSTLEARSGMAVFHDARWEDSVPRFWCAGDAFETRLLEAMSLIAPEVERFVIGAVRRSLRLSGARPHDSAAMAFILEEAEHSRAHNAFNRRLASQGVDLAKALACVRTLANLARRWLPVSGQLAVAAACEHLSALLSLSFLRAERKSEIRPASVSRFFEQHARDELGHRAIVFDLLRNTASGGWLARAGALMLVSIGALFCVPRVVNVLLHPDAPGNRARVWARGMPRLLRTGGWVTARPFLRGWLAYFGWGFHPRCLPDA